MFEFISNLVGKVEDIFDFYAILACGKSFITVLINITRKYYELTDFLVKNKKNSELSLAHWSWYFLTAQQDNLL